MLDLAPAPALQWAENESTGYRHIGVVSEGKKIFVIAAHKIDGVWESSVTPLGFSYTKDEILNLGQLFQWLNDNLFDFLERDEEITHDDILEYLGIIHDHSH